MKNKHNTLRRLSEDFAVEEFMKQQENHEFSAHYQEEREKLIRQVAMKQHARRQWTGKTLAAAAAGILILAVPATAFAAKQIAAGFQVKKEQTANYEYEVSFTNDKIEQDTAQGTSTDEKSTLYHTYVQMKVNYWPEGYKPKSSNSEYKQAFNGEWDSNQNISVSLVTLLENQTITKSNATATKDITVGGKEATIFYKNVLQDTGFDKDMMVFFKEYGYAVELYAQVNVPEEELVKVAESVELIPCEKDVATVASAYGWPTKTDSGSASSAGKVTSKQLDDSQFLSIGEPFVLKDFKGFNSSKLELTVEDVEIMDSIAGLDEKAFGYDFKDVKKLTDEAGNLSGYTHQNIERGDRVNTVDQLISEEHTDVKLVFVTMKLRNTSDKAVDEVKIAPQICCMEGEDGEWTLPSKYASEKMHSEGWAAYCDVESMYEENPSIYSDIDRNYYAQRYSIEAGKEMEYHVAYIVDADKMNNMVLFFNAYGQIYGASDGNKADCQAIVQLYE